MPTRTCKVCGEKTTIASKDLKYLHDATDFICSPECVASKIISYKDTFSGPPVKSVCSLCIEGKDTDPLGRTAAYSWKLGKAFRSEYEASVAEFLHTCAIFPVYEKYSYNVGDQTYTPDFYIESPYNCFLEVKGLFSLGKRAKLTAFLNEHPEVNFILIPWILRSQFIERTNTNREDW